MLKTVAIAVGAWLAATLALSIPVGILGSSSLVWGQANQYASIPIPGTETVQLPKGRTDAAVALVASGRGDDTPALTIPDDLVLTVTPGATVTQDLQRTQNATGEDVDTQRNVFRIDAPKAGAYRVKVSGRFDGIGINPRLWLGHGPPLPGSLVPAVAAVLALLGLSVWRFRR